MNVLAFSKPASWPTLTTTSDALDLQQRLARLPFYMPTMQGGVATVNNGFGAAQPASWPKLWTGGFGDFATDLQTIINKAPQLLSQVVTILDKAAPQLPTILKMVEDPAFPVLVQKVETLQKIEAAKPAAPGGAPGPAKPGVGLDRVVPLWDAAIFIESHPAAAFVKDHPVLVGTGIAVVLAGIGFGVGMGIGRWTKKCRAGFADRHYRRRRN